MNVPDERDALQDIELERGHYRDGDGEMSRMASGGIGHGGFVRRRTGDNSVVQEQAM